MVDKDFNDVIRDLEDSIFGLEDESKVEDDESSKEKEPERRHTFPTLIDQETADGIMKDFMKKEKNQRKYEGMGSELLFRPYWFFTYTCELVMRDQDGNIIDSEEIGGRMAIDATNGAVADYLQDLLDHEPIEAVDLSDEMGQVGGEAKIIEPKLIGEERVERFVKQKIAGVLRADKDNVSVAGFELLWSPVYRYWMTIKKRTHNLQLDGCGGYPLNYDDIPLRKRTWNDIIADDIELLKDPKKWKEFLKNKGKAMKGMSLRKGGSAGAAAAAQGAGQPQGSRGNPNNKLIEAMGGVVGLAMFLLGLSQRPPDAVLIIMGALIVGVIFWVMNHKRKKPLIPLPPPPYVSGYGPPLQ